MSLFITFEGIEGSGKSTQLARLSQHLDSKGIDYIATKEPGGTQLGQIIRQWLLDPNTSFKHRYSEVLLFIADRLEHVETVIKPALTKGSIVLCDRYKDSTIAYQCAGRKLDPRLIDTLNNLVDLDPDITLLYDCSVKEGLKRAKARAKLDRFEDEAIAFHERIHAAYQSLTKTYPKRFHIIDADASIDVVQDQTLEHLSPYIKGL